MINELPLNPLWESLGATLKTEGGWRIPSIFKDFSSEYTAVRKNAGLLDYSFRSKIQVAGKDAISFLHNILTNDIKNLGLGGGCPSALLHATGKILSFMNVSVFSNYALLDVEMGHEQKLLDLLSKFLITEDVKIVDVTRDFCHLALEGPRAEAMAQALFPGPFADLKEYQHANFHLGNSDVTLIRLSRTGNNGYQLLIPKENAAAVAERILVVGKLYGLRPVGFSAAEILRIEAGIARFGVDMDENVTLSETGLDDLAASETKGCYPGQEVVARTKTYHGLKRKLTGFIFKKGPLPQAYDKIFKAEAASGNLGEEIGWITSACVSPSLDQGIALGYVAKGFFEATAAVKIAARGTLIHASTTSLPFISLSRAGQRGLS